MRQTRRNGLGGRGRLDGPATLLVAVVVGGLCLPEKAEAQMAWGDSPVFAVDVTPDAHGPAMGDDAGFELDATLVARGWGDSNTFGMSGPPPARDIRMCGLSPTYPGVFAQGVEVFNTFTAEVDWGQRSPWKVVFGLDGQAQHIVTSGNFAQAAFNMGTDLQYGRSGARNELTAYAVAADGAYSQIVSLPLYGLALPEWAISETTKPGNNPPTEPRVGWRIEPLSGKLTFYGEVEVLKGGIEGVVNVPKSIPEVGGKWGVEIYPLNFAWELSAQPRFGDGAGLTGTFDLSGSWGAEAKCGTKRKGEASATLSGAGQFYPEFKLTDVSAELAGSFTFLFPRVPLLCAWPPYCCNTGYCPYFQASIKPEFAGIVGMEEGEPSLIAGLKFKNATLELGVTLAGTVGAGSEGSIYYIAGTIGGHPYVILQFPGDPDSMCLNEYIQEAGFDLEARFVVECAWWKFEEEWTFNIFTCPDGKKYLVGTPSGYRKYGLVERDYLAAPEGYCVFPEDKGGPRDVGPMPDPILNVGTGAMPALAATSDDGLMLFVYDDAGQPTGQHQEIYYARWTGSQWAAHAPLTVNSNPDVQPAAAIDAAGKEIAVWVTAPQPTGSETGPRDVLPGFEIAYSTYDTGTSSWAAPLAITSNAYADMLPWIEKLPGGALRVCWITSPTNAVPVWHDEEIAPSLDVMAADWSGTAFGLPYAVATGLQAVSPPSVTRSATHEFLAYTLDTDNNSGTAEDREVMVRVREIGQAWGADVQLTTDALSDTSAQVATDAAGVQVVVWVKRMVPFTPPGGEETHVDQLWFSTWDGVTWSAPVLALETDGITEARLIRNEAGKLVLFWVAASQEFSDVYYSVYDAALAAWGPPQQVTTDQGAETMLALTESAGNILAAYVKRRVDLVSDPNGLPLIGLSDIYLMQHVPAKDLFVGASDISFDPDPPVPGQSANVCANVHLAGDFTVEDVAVDFYDGDPAGSGTLIGSAVVDVILPGEAVPACVAWPVPTDGLVHQVFVVVDPANAIPETDDTGNNKASAGVFAPDLRVSAPAVTAYPGPDTVLVGCNIRNDGSAAAGASTLEVRRDGQTGPVIYTAEVPALAAGESVSVQFAWDVTSLATGMYTLAFLVDTTGGVSESNEANNVSQIEAAVRGDLQAEQWSASIVGSTAQVTVRNVGAKPMAASVVRVVRGETTLGEAALPAMNAGATTDVDITISQAVPPGWLWIVANPDSDGSDEVSLLNNAASVVIYSTGDIDGDSDADMDDVTVFVSVLLGLDVDPYHVAASDVNLSGVADGLDVQPFVDLLVP